MRCLKDGRKNIEKHKNHVRGKLGGKMDAQLLMKTATLAGELMLRSGAETYRVEDTMSYMLKTASDLESSDVVVIMTGITATLKVKDEDAITVIKRVNKISTNLNVVACVNEISRELCSKQLSLEEAYKELLKIEEKVYSNREYNVGVVSICVGFALFFGGGLLEVLASIIVGIVSNVFEKISKKLELHDFLLHIFVSVGISAASMLLKGIVMPNMDMDVVMISCIMPLVPGMAITNAVRDILRGDYLAGSARVLEAFLRAAGIAIGMGLGMAGIGYIL